MVLAVVAAVLVAALVMQNRRLAAVEGRLARLTRGSDDGNLQDVLEAHLDSVGRVVDDVDALAAKAAMLESRSERAFQRIGLVRYNPFEDTGGNQSFALALLDGREDGIVISSLHSRGGTRIYAKTLARGRPEGALSNEEAQAVEIARSVSGGRTMDGTLDVRIASPARQPAAAPVVTSGPAVAPDGAGVPGMSGVSGVTGVPAPAAAPIAGIRAVEPGSMGGDATR